VISGFRRSVNEVFAQNVRNQFQSTLRNIPEERRSPVNDLSKYHTSRSFTNSKGSLVMHIKDNDRYLSAERQQGEQ